MKIWCKHVGSIQNFNKENYSCGNFHTQSANAPCSIWSFNGGNRTCENFHTWGVKASCSIRNFNAENSKCENFHTKGVKELDSLKKIHSYEFFHTQNVKKSCSIVSSQVNTNRHWKITSYWFVELILLVTLDPYYKYLMENTW